MKLTILFLALGLYAADKPKITAEMREAYFQAKADVLEAMAAHDSAQKRLDAAVKAMQAVCPLITDAQGKPQCQPEPPKSEQKKGN